MEEVVGSHGIVFMPWVRIVKVAQALTAQNECRGFPIETAGETFWLSEMRKRKFWVNGDIAAGHPGVWVFTTAASIAVGITPIWILETYFGVSRRITVGYGVLARVVGAGLVKLPLHHFVVERPLRARLSAGQLAVSQGVLSAVSELGVALLFFAFVLPQLDFWQVVGFGVGAGAVEAVILPFIGPFRGTTLEEDAAEVRRTSACNQVAQWLSVLERAWAMLLQVGTRGLMYLAIVAGNLLPAIIGVAAFAAVDGGVYYGHLKKWRFDSPQALWRMHAALAAMAFLVTGTFVLLAT